VISESGNCVFERRATTTDHPFAGLEGVFGAVTLPRDQIRLREKSAAVLPRRTVVVDAGPLKAAIDRGDVDHAWAVRAWRWRRSGRRRSSRALHGLENHPAAVRALRRLVARISVVSVAPERVDSVFDEVERWAPRMDFADACAVVLVRSSELAFVLTTDFRGFSTYRVPFAAPERAFHTWLPDPLGD
jgi:predicted nucleic acid-binding protein